MYTSQQLLGSCGKCRCVYHTWILQGFWNINYRKSPLALSNMDEFLRTSSGTIAISFADRRFVMSIFVRVYPPTEAAMKVFIVRNPRSEKCNNKNKSKKSDPQDPRFTDPEKKPGYLIALYSNLLNGPLWSVGIRSHETSLQEHRFTFPNSLEIKKLNFFGGTILCIPYAHCSLLQMVLECFFFCYLNTF